MSLTRSIGWEDDSTVRSPETCRLSVRKEGDPVLQTTRPWSYFTVASYAARYAAFFLCGSEVWVRIILLRIFPIRPVTQDIFIT